MNNQNSIRENNRDVVVQSKIKLMRNLDKTPFPCRMSNDLRKSVCKKLYAALQNSKLAGDFDWNELGLASQAERFSFFEKGYISKAMAKQGEYCALLLSKDEKCAVMLCEEEHICINTVCDGDDLKSAYQRANALDDVFIKSVKIAFDKELGFLTSNPMHLGTGLIASVVLHLPAISRKGLIQGLGNMVSKLGFLIKPVFNGGFYELSNEISMGITEENVLENLNAICAQIVNQERKLRNDLIEYEDFEDKIFRAMGTLKMARKLSTDEFYNLISLARLGASVHAFDLPFDKIDKMIYSLGTASIMAGAQGDMNSDDAQRIRAQFIRENI